VNGRHTGGYGVSALKHFKLPVADKPMFYADGVLIQGGFHMPREGTKDRYLNQSTRPSTNHFQRSIGVAQSINSGNWRR
jgi:hypothetical protein